MSNTRTPLKILSWVSFPILILPLPPSSPLAQVVSDSSGSYEDLPDCTPYAATPSIPSPQSEYRMFQGWVILLSVDHWMTLYTRSPRCSPVLWTRSSPRSGLLLYIVCPRWTDQYQISITLILRRITEKNRIVLSRIPRTERAGGKTHAYPSLYLA